MKKKRKEKEKKKQKQKQKQKINNMKYPMILWNSKSK